MSEHWHPHGDDNESSRRQPRPLRCWACESLLAIQGPDGRVILEADATEHVQDDQRVLICGCGEPTIVPVLTEAGDRQAPMTETERPLTPEARLVMDYRHETRGLWRDGAVFRIRIFSRGDQAPVVIASEAPENTNVSVTNFAEVLAAEVIAQHLPQRFDYDEPAVWLEHYPPTPGRKREKFEFDRVTFHSWTPRVKYVGGVKRISLGEPDWKPMTPEDLATLVGSETARALTEERPLDTQVG